MTAALCLGGAASVRDDWTAALALGDFDFIVACNDVGAIWPGRLDAWVTLHPEKLTAWRDQRRANGHSDAARYLVHGDCPPEWTELVEFRFPGQSDSGSSGLFAAKAALNDLGADRAVLAGIPLSRTSHFFDAVQWEAAGGYRTVFEGLRPVDRARIRSMSGWTAHFFGLPTTEWLAIGSTYADVPAPTLESTRMSRVKLDKIAYEPHPVSLERKKTLNAKGYKVMDIAFAPKGAKVVHEPTTDPVVIPDDWENLHWTQQVKLAEAITGRPIEPAEGQTKPAAAQEIIKTAKGDPQDEGASNGLTRREIEADLTAMHVEFDPADKLDDLAALRDLAREARDKAGA